MDKWTTKIPKSAGYYWFFGDPFTEMGSKDLPKNKIYFVEIHKTISSFAYITQGNFMYPHTIHLGYWMTAELPKPPEE